VHRHRALAQHLQRRIGDRSTVTFLHRLRLAEPRRSVTLFRHRISIRDVPLFGGEKVELTFAFGTPLRFGTGAIALAPLVREAAPLSTEVAATAWPRIAEALAADAHQPPAPANPPRRVGAWRIEAWPAYAPINRGDAHLEDDSPWADAVNAAIEAGDSDRINRIFGAGRPFVAVTWRVSARDLTNSKDLVVRMSGQAGPGEVRVELLPGIVPHAAILIRFPEAPADALYEAHATAEMVDTLGNTGAVEYFVGSHVLPIEGVGDLDGILKTVAGLARADERLLLFASRIDPPADSESVSMLLEPTFRRGRAVRIATIDAAADSFVTIQELRRLMLGAAVFAGPQP
jgi:hypothetical protein